MKFSDYSFGVTSAVMTGLAIIVSLSSVVNYRVSIVTALLVIAIADNISDSFGLHVQQESQNLSNKEVYRITFRNFAVRLIVSMILVFFVLALPLNFAIASSIAFGVILIILLSYFIAKSQKVSPYSAILQHLVIALIVMVASFFLRALIMEFISGVA